MVAGGLTSAAILECIRSAKGGRHVSTPRHLGGSCRFIDGNARARSGTEDKKSESSGKAVIPVFRLHGSYSESGGDDGFNLSGEQTIPLRDLIAKMKKAAGDPAVKAVVILCDSPSLGNAQIEELRQVMDQIKAAGKEVYAHADSVDMKNFVLLSGASRVSLVPTSDLWITGLNGESPYIRGLLNLLGVKPDFLTCGEYKSAAEMFMAKGRAPRPRKCKTGCSIAYSRPTSS